MRLRCRLSVLVSLAAILGACSGTPSPLTTPTGAAATPSAAASVLEATPTLTATSEGVTPVPAEPTPTPTPAPAEPDAKITRTFFKVWTDSIGYAHYEAIVELQNVGGGSADIGGSQDYSIYAKDGSVLETGSFTYAFPKVLGPGQKGYLVESSTFDEGVKAASVGKFDDSSLTWSATSDDPTALFKVTNVKVRQESYGTGLEASGVVTNTTSTDATMAVAGIIFFDAKGTIIGGLIDNSLDNIFAGKSKAFKTSYPGTPPLKPTNVSKTVVIAFDFTF